MRVRQKWQSIRTNRGPGDRYEELDDPRLEATLRDELDIWHPTLRDVLAAQIAGVRRRGVGGGFVQAERGNEWLEAELWGIAVLVFHALQLERS